MSLKSLVLDEQDKALLQDINCIHCSSKLNDNNWLFSNKKKNYRICTTCSRNLRNTWRAANKEKINQQNKKNYQLNKHKYYLKAKDWVKKNREHVNRVKRSHTAYRRSMLKQRLVSWANLEKIKAFYKMCPLGYHVDHIIPLQGINVSGLHVENNLQYLPATVNLSKGNKYNE